MDLVVDYTGSGQYYHPEDATDTSIWNDPIEGYNFTAQLDREKKDIIWLTPSPANNTESIAVTRDFATAEMIVSMEDLAAYINAGKAFKLIASASFVENPMGLLGYEEAYGFKLTNDQIISLASGNTAEMLKALAEGTNDVNASLVYGTDGALDKLNLVVLEDPKHIPPVYLPAPVIRKAVLDVYPEIETILKPIFESLTLEVLQNLNAKVAYDGEDATMVAENYLKDNGFDGLYNPDADPGCACRIDKKDEFMVCDIVNEDTCYFCIPGYLTHRDPETDGEHKFHITANKPENG